MEKFDFYAIQDYVDGFGNDTYTIAIFPTFEQAVKYADTNCRAAVEIVGQKWGEYYNMF